MEKTVDGFIKEIQHGVIGALESVHKGATSTLTALQKSAQVSVEAVQKNTATAISAVQNSARVSRETIEWLFEIKGRPLSVLNGVVGDTLAAQNSKLAIPMTLIGNPQGGRLCIFVHGLCDSEASWQFLDDPNKSYGSLLGHEFGYAPIYVRYNTGLHISTNGQWLVHQIDDLCRNLAHPVEDIIFIGHSMGGLVIRSACYYAQKQNAPWIQKISKIFLLGTPHSGNDYEKLGNLVSTCLKVIPFTTYLAKFGNKRSAGIKDLRFGYLLDEDWLEHDPDTLWKDNRHPVPLLAGVDYYIIAGSLAKESDNILTKYFGDGVVPAHAAVGRSLRRSMTLQFPQKNFRIIKGLSHTRLIRDPKVYHQIQEWCRQKK